MLHSCVLMKYERNEGEEAHFIRSLFNLKHKCRERSRLTVTTKGELNVNMYLCF